MTSRNSASIFPGGSGGTEAGSLSSGTHLPTCAKPSKLRRRLRRLLRGHVHRAGARSRGRRGRGSLRARHRRNGRSAPLSREPGHRHRDDSGDLRRRAHGGIWYGTGPGDPGHPGGVVARYPDGNPAITELWSGNGFVVLWGVHPTATASTLSSLGVSSSDGTHPETA